MNDSPRAPSRPEVVFKDLVFAIVSGHYPAGASIPSERVLAEEKSVSRSVIREALTRLDQLGLVRIQQGGATRVNDFRRSAGLDLLDVLAGFAPLAAEATQWWIAQLQMRAALGADVARLCSECATSAQRESLLEGAQEMAGTADPHERFKLEVQFWEEVHDAADNIAYRLAFNSFMKTIPLYAPTSIQVSLLESQESGYRIPLAKAIMNHDAELAEREARKSLRGTADRIAKALGKKRPK